MGGARALAVLARPSAETVAAVVGGLLAGVPVVPVPPDAGPVERAHILRDSGAELLAGADEPSEEPGIEALAVDLGERHDYGGPEPAPERPAFVLYTSGTTGPPKGALLSRAAVAADLDALAEAWAWTQDDTLVHGLPLFHVHGLVLGVLGALRIGSRLVHTGRPTPKAYAEAAGSLYFGVPTVWSRIAGDEASARALAGARLLVSGSAPLPVPVFTRLTELTGLRPIERYGMTETLITVSTRWDGERRPAASGCRCPAWRPAWSARTAHRCRLTGRASASCRSAGRPCSTATSTGRRPTQRCAPPTAGSAPGTSPSSARTGSTGSSAAPRWT